MISQRMKKQQLHDKGILCSELVKAKMNGSLWSPALTNSTQSMTRRLQVDASILFAASKIENYFLTETHFIEQFQNGKRKLFNTNPYPLTHDTPSQSLPPKKYPLSSPMNSSLKHPSTFSVSRQV